MLGLGPTDVLLLALLPLLLATSALFSGSETALFSLSRYQRRQLGGESGLAGRAVEALLAEPRSLLITLLMSNMTVNVLYFVISTILQLHLAQAGQIGALGRAAAGIAPLLLLILFGEVLPKLVAARVTMALTRLLAVPLLLVHRTLGPLRIAVNVLVITPLARLVAPRQRPPQLSSEELAALLEMSEARGVLDPSEEQLLQQVLSLGVMKVRDLMAPRVDIVAHNLADPPPRLIERFEETGLTALPVFRHDLDHVEGLIYAREALLRRPRTWEQLKPLIREVSFVPELQRADDLLIHLRKTGTTVAVAVDEYGGTAGIVSLEDVAEQMVGHIPGPYEPVAPPKTQFLELGVWRVSAGLSIHDWGTAFGASVPAHGLTTLGGLVMARLGRLPKVGDRLAIGNLLVEVERMDGRRLESLILRLQPAPAAGAAA